MPTAPDPQFNLADMDKARRELALKLDKVWQVGLHACFDSFDSFGKN